MLMYSIQCYTFSLCSIRLVTMATTEGEVKGERFRSKRRKRDFNENNNNKIIKNDYLHKIECIIHNLM